MSENCLIKEGRQKIQETEAQHLTDDEKLSQMFGSNKDVYRNVMLGLC